jgi:type IV pilus assembly protein PilF
MRILFVLLSAILCGCVSQGTGSYDSNINYDEAASTRISLGLTYLRNGNYTQAKQNLDKALEFAPRSADAHYSLAYYFQLVGENQRAEEYFDNAMRLAPSNADIANSYGAFLCQQNRYEEGKTYFLRAVDNKRYANSAQTYENMAICANKEGFTDDAIQYLQSALNHQPGRLQSLILLAELHASQQQYLEAERALATIERYGRIDDNILWLQMDIARQQRKLEKAKNYGDMLVSVYPNSSLTKRYLDNPIITAPVSAPTVIPPIVRNQDVDIPRQHIVKQGENLFRISVKYNIAMRSLIEWNNLPESGDIKMDMALWLISPEER